MAKTRAVSAQGLTCSQILNLYLRSIEQNLLQIGFGVQEDEWRKRLLQTFGPKHLEAWRCHFRDGEDGGQIRMEREDEECCSGHVELETSTRHLGGSLAVGIIYCRSHLRCSHSGVMSGNCQQEQLSLRI